MKNYRKIGLSVLALSLTVFVSCKDEENQETAPAQNQVENTQTTQNTQGTTAALNPAHGQPGHRCEIPVGAPLDQDASATIQQQQPVTTNPNSSPVRVNNSNATPTKNPPHGQPGHDCAVPVGADLTSSN